MGSILSFLSPALTAATQAAGAYQGAEAQAGQAKQAAVMQALQMARQAKMDALQAALQGSTIDKNNAQTYQIQHPAPVIKTGPNGVVYDLSDPSNPKALTGGSLQQVVEPDDSVKFVDPTKPPPGLKARGPAAPQDHYSAIVSVDPKTGAPTYATLNTRSGEITPTTTLAKPGTAGGAGGARTEAQVDVARTQATQADHDMNEFEAGIASGKVKLDPVAFYLAKKALSAPPGSSTMAESALNTQYPDLARYVRSARQIAVAERLITPRGGSNAMTAQEAALSAAGAFGDPRQVQQAQAYRRALINGLEGHVAGGNTRTSGPAGTPPTTSGNPFADLIPTGHE